MWSTASNLVALSLGAWVTACSGAEGFDVSERSSYDGASEESAGEPAFDALGQEITACDDHQYDHWRYLSGLAVAAANELGRWHPADFTLQTSDSSVRLSSTGLARCGSYGCPNTQAILQMQDLASAYVPRHDPTLLRNLLVSYLDRQKTFNNSTPVPNHTLTLARVSNDVCGLRYHFRVGGGTTSGTVLSGSTELKAAHSNRCIDIAAGTMADGGRVQQYDCWGGGNQEFALDSVGNSQYRIRNVMSGKCLGVAGASTANAALIEQRTCGANDSQTFNLNNKGSGRYELKNVKSGKCVDVSGNSTANVANIQLYSCSGGANQTFSAPGIVSGTSSPGTSPAKLFDQLKLFGQGENGYLMFQSTATEVSIDPMGTVVDGGSSAASGACYSGSTVYSQTNIAGSCCMVSGVYGTLERSSFNARMFVCR